MRERTISSFFAFSRPMKYLESQSRTMSLDSSRQADFEGRREKRLLTIFIKRCVCFFTYPSRGLYLHLLYVPRYCTSTHVLHCTCTWYIQYAVRSYRYTECSGRVTLLTGQQTEHMKSKCKRRQRVYFLPLFSIFKLYCVVVDNNMSIISLQWPIRI